MCIAGGRRGGGDEGDGLVLVVNEGRTASATETNLPENLKNSPEGRTVLRKQIATLPAPSCRRCRCRPPALV